MVGKLVSLECAVLPGMWYTRNQYAAMTASGIRPDAKKTVKNFTFIKVTEGLREEWSMWIYFLIHNTGAPWKSFQNVYVLADVASDASGRSYAGVVDFPQGNTRVTAGSFLIDFFNKIFKSKKGKL